MKLNILYEASSDSKLRNLERAAMAGDIEARRELLLHGLRGHNIGSKLWQPEEIETKIAPEATKKARRLAQNNKEWDILYQAETDEDLIQNFGKFWGSLQDAMRHADKEINKKFPSYNIESSYNPWEPNEWYPPHEVYIKYYGHDSNLDYAVAYVGEANWGSLGEVPENEDEDWTIET